MAASIPLGFELPPNMSDGGVEAQHPAFHDLANAREPFRERLSPTTEPSVLVVVEDAIEYPGCDQCELFYNQLNCTPSSSN